MITKFKFDLQLHGGKGGSTTNVQSYQPTKQEIRMQEQAADYSEAISPNAKWLNDTARKLLESSLGDTQVNYNELNKNAQEQISNAQNTVSGLAKGELPAEYQQNMQDSINRAVESSVGQSINGLGNRGILNSSVTNQALNDTSVAAANAASDKYLESIGTLNGLAGQQAGLAGAGITTAAAAQEAAQAPALSAWNASLGLNGANLGALNALGGQGTTTTRGTTSGGSGLFGGILGGLGGNSGLFCFTEETKVKTPSGDKEIRKINKGDTVMCPNDNGTESEETVIEIMKPHYNDVYAVVVNNKMYVNTTLSQPLLTSDGGFILVKDINVGETILANRGKVQAVVHSGERKVYDLKVSGENKYFANGFIAKGGTDEWVGEA